MRKYFDNQDHLILKKQLRSLFKDPILLDILDRIIESYATEAGKGVPIGNLTSQYFANHYLAGADHFAKEILKMRGYVRYMDDIVLWHNDKATLRNAGLKLKQYTENALGLMLKPFCLNRSTHGLPFLGYLLYPNEIRLAHRSRSRFIRKMRLYEKLLDSEVWSESEYQNHVMPLIAFTEYASAREFRKKVLSQL